MRVLIISLILSISFANFSFAYNYYESGKTEFKKGNYTKANELFKNELIENPENLKCRYFYAQSFVGINNLAKAQKEYEKVIEQSPNSELAKLSSIAISKIHGYYSEKIKKTPATTASRHSFELNYIQNAQSNGKIVRWNLSRMPIKIYIESTPYFSAVKNAFDFWIKASDPKTISYILVNNPKNADISVSFVSEIGKKSDKAYLSGIATPFIKGYVLESCNIKLRTIDENNIPVSQEEIFPTALHEIGHSLGIWGHSSIESDIMYDSESANAKKSAKTLSNRDINTLRLLYRLDPDVSNFAQGESPVINSAKNKAILGNTNERINKKFQEAVDYVKKYPKNALSWTSLGNVYYDSKQYQEAITCYQKSLEIDSSFAESRSGLALSYEKAGDFNKAVEQFSILVEENPENINYSHNLALYLIKNKKDSEASGVIKNLIKVNPDAVNDKNIQSLMKYLNKSG